MSRIVKKDFEDLVDFLSNYTLKDNLLNNESRMLLSKCHKKYFALLIFCTEIFDTRAKPSKRGQTIKNSALQNTYLQEFVSDVGGALFNWCHGAYKASRLLMRSGIENFIKGMSIPTAPSIVAVKSVYEVFNRAASSPAFQGRLRKGIFDRIHNDYKTLCADAHGKGVQHMQQTKSLNYFPGFESKKAKDSSVFICSIVNSAVEIMCLESKEVFLAMHYTNVDIVSPVLSRSVKRNLHSTD